MTEKIFISYAHEDRGIVDTLEQELRKHGIIGEEPVSIIDPIKELKLGDDIRDTILKQIKSASKIVFVDTDSTDNSHWVNYEAGIAYALKKPIIIIGRRGSGKTSFLNSIFNKSSIVIVNSDQ